MPRAEGLPLGHGQRQDAGRRQNASLADDDRAVMQRRLGIEDVHQQLAGERIPFRQ